MGNCVHNMCGMSVFAKQLNIQNCENSAGNCVHWMYRMSRFVEKLNDLICVDWTVNCTHNMYEMSGIAENLNIQNCENSTGNCVYYIHEMFGLVEKLNIQNCVYSTKNCVHYIFMECLDMQRNWMECLDLQKIWISWTDGKLCTLYTYGMSGYAKKLNIQNSVSWMGNYAHNMYEMSGYVGKIEYPELLKFNKKLCTLYVRNVWISRKIE